MIDSNIAERKAALTVATARLEEAVRRLAPKHVGGEMEAYEVAFQELMDAERQLAKAEQRPYAIPVDCPLLWDTGTPLPTLLQSDNDTLLFFLLSDDDQNVGQIEFERCRSTSFGSPGDETFKGHPLYGSGFEPYRPMEVLNSPWITQLQKIDSVHPRHDPAVFGSAKHFLLPFHDTTFECVARSFQASRTPGPLSEAVRRAVTQLY